LRIAWPGEEDGTEVCESVYGSSKGECQTVVKPPLRSYEEPRGGCRSKRQNTFGRKKKENKDRGTKRLRFQQKGVVKNRNLMPKLLQESIVKIQNAGAKVTKPPSKGRVNRNTRKSHHKGAHQDRWLALAAVCERGNGHEAGPMRTARRDGQNRSHSNQNQKVLGGGGGGGGGGGVVGVGGGGRKKGEGGVGGGGGGGCYVPSTAREKLSPKRKDKCLD